MRKFAKPIVVISKCITFENVRWNSKIIASDLVEKLKSFVDFIPICPEVEIGLGVPREPLRIVLIRGEKRLMQPTTGLDFTEKMRNFTESFLGSLRDVDGFILKSGSPSCGLKGVKIYSEISGSAWMGRGPGFFGGAISKKFPNLAAEDEKRLLNLRIREHFLIKLFALANFRKAKNSGSIKELMRFHSENKLLLMAYNPRKLRLLSSILANREGKSLSELSISYQTLLFDALRRPPSIKTNVNVIMKILRHFSKQLLREEKQFILNSLKKYRTGIISLSACLSAVKFWMSKLNEAYWMRQSFFEPFPEELTRIEMTETDGK